MPVARRVGSNSGHRGRPSARMTKKTARAPKDSVDEEKKVGKRTKGVTKRVNRPSKSAKVQNTTKKAAKPQKRKKAAKATERQTKKARVLPVKRHIVTHVSHPKVRVFYKKDYTSVD